MRRFDVLYRQVAGWRGLAWAALAAAAPALQASPTPDEYRVCHRQGAQVAEMCLNDAPGAQATVGAQCWQRAQMVQQNCYRDVRAAHQPDPRRTAAMRRAEEEARRRAQEAHRRALEEQQ